MGKLLFLTLGVEPIKIEETPTAKLTRIGTALIPAQRLPAARIWIWGW